jgi:hypothetical protein
MNKDNIKIIIASVVVAIVIAVSFSTLQYPQNEGFNPTDEGVVLAQSWRIINGEVPHKDFVSIRPAGSGYLHSIALIIQGDAVVNARWIVIFQFFTIALVISLTLYKLLSKQYQKFSIVVFIAMLLSVFTLSILNYNLYSWTTIDAVFWSVLAIPFILNEKGKASQIAGLIFLSIAALSRQTFVLVAAAGFLHVFYEYRKSIAKGSLIVLAGALPFILYFLMLAAHGAIGDFISQMTGRTEFLQTGILQFVKKFIFGLSTPLNIICLILTILLYARRKSGLREIFIAKGYHLMIVAFYIIFAFAHTVKYFFAQSQDITTLPFELFYMLIFLEIYHFVMNPKSKKLRILIAFIILISWISAISLGDNTPVFASGILFAGILGLAADILLSKKTKFDNIFTNKIIFSVFSLAIVVSGFISQQKFNYRDNSSKMLTGGLNYASDEFGMIKTNPAVIAYYSDLKDIYDTLPKAQNNTIVFPHNAMFYPVMKSKNPMSIDWLIPNEYPGNKDRVKSDLEKLKARDLTYFITDKVDLRVINKSIQPRVYEDDMIFDFILLNCERVNCESEFVEVWRLRH